LAVELNGHRKVTMMLLLLAGTTVLVWLKAADGGSNWQLS